MNISGKSNSRNLKFMGRLGGSRIAYISLRPDIRGRLRSKGLYKESHIQPPGLSPLILTGLMVVIMLVGGLLEIIK